MQIDSGFDGGNIDWLGEDESGALRLAIRKDNQSDFYQWFHFRLSGGRGRDCVLAIVNAGGAAYAEGWRGYQAVASYDRRRWFRVPTDYDGTVLTLRHRPERDAVYYAYFAPYSMERHLDLLAWAAERPGVSLTSLGRTLDGQPLDLLTVGEPGEGKRSCWAIARQHPGETMAEWWMEGFIERLLDENDALARRLRERARFHIVPNMNPDGSRRGHLRTNAAGANLNREWHDPTPARSPEVLLVRSHMQATGVDWCLDVHGDEVLPYNFLIGTSGIPSYSTRLAELADGFRRAMMQANPDFQITQGYPETSPGRANMTMCSNWVAERFDCLAMTLEMPFKDTGDTPRPEEGWSPARSRRLGAAALDALAAVIDRLR
jgi:murein tripeptide amidase MpaA